MAPDLYAELQQAKPFATLQQEVFVNLLRTSAVLNHRLESALKQHGLTTTQFNVLRILRGAGRSGLLQSQIRDRLIAIGPDIPRLLQRLETLGLIRQEREDRDRRLVSAFITANGRSALLKADRVVEHVHQEMFAHMTEAQLRKLNLLLTLAR